MFDAEPETKLFFKDLAHVHTEEEMTANVVFRAHIINIMSSLDNSIVNLNKPELVVAFMQKLSNSHRRHRVERRHFGVSFPTGSFILQVEIR